jgi:hypothetical protein
MQPVGAGHARCRYCIRENPGYNNVNFSSPVNSSDSDSPVRIIGSFLVVLGLQTNHRILPPFAETIVYYTLESSWRTLYVSLHLRTVAEGWEMRVDFRTLHA